MWHDNSEPQYDGFESHEDGDGYDDDEEDMDFVVDDDLAAVDAALRKKGRLNDALDPTIEGPEATEKSNNRNGTVEAGGTLTGKNQGAHPHEILGLDTHKPTARGTGAQAANNLKSEESSNFTGTPAQPSSASRWAIGADCRNPTTSAGGGADGLYSPTRRRDQKTPFIQAKGLSLTYAQARLFGLVGPGLPSPLSTGDCPIPLSTVLKATANRRDTTRTVSGANASGRRQAEDASARDKKQWQSQTYSSTRMEYLARPNPGKTGSGTEGGFGRGVRSPPGRREEPSFTWKRSRKAEAAMRDPACGYDFVPGTGGGYGGVKKSFLGRVDAYSSYSRTKLQTTRAEQDYAARLDKLECPE